jgi:hypothetical protein
MPLSKAELSLIGRKGANKSWGNTVDRAARTAKARQAFEERFLVQADGDPRRAESLRKAYYADLTLKSVQSRRRRAALVARMTEQELAAAKITAYVEKALSQDPPLSGEQRTRLAELLRPVRTADVDA